MRAGAVLFLLSSATLSACQSADVRVNLDAIFGYSMYKHRPGNFVLYSPLGRTSTLSITAFLPNGLRAYASQRLERIPNDPSNDPLEEYYLEDEDIWRVGKQYLPFGSGNIIRENVVAARGNAGILEHLNLDGAICDGGPGEQRGFTARLGERIGASVAIGRHFGISPTSLDVIRLPQDSPGKGAGWKQIVGFDGYQKFGPFTTTAEFVTLSGGESNEDHDASVLDLIQSFQPNRGHYYAVGYTKSFSQDADFFRFLSRVAINKHAAFEPTIRFRGTTFSDLSLAVRIRF